MPLYEFYCPTCHHCFEVRRSLSDGTNNVKCPTCTGDRVQRVFTPVVAFSAGNGGTATVGSKGCSSCSATHCSGCPSSRRK